MLRWIKFHFVLQLWWNKSAFSSNVGLQLLSMIERLPKCCRCNDKGIIDGFVKLNKCGSDFVGIFQAVHKSWISVVHFQNLAKTLCFHVLHKFLLLKQACLLSFNFIFYALNCVFLFWLESCQHACWRHPCGPFKCPIWEYGPRVEVSTRSCRPLCWVLLWVK